MRIIRNYDVASYYPALMLNCGYTSRSIPSPDIFREVVDKRIAAKNSGDKVTANAFKLVVNTTYGAMLNRYNNLHDPLMGRSVCISGQLYLLELANHLVADCETLQVINLNTDGVMVSFEEDEYPIIKAITEEWQERTGFVLEEDKIHKIVQKDINNYVEVQLDGSVKTKGGYLVRGIAPAGAFNINNNACIVATALKEYFVNNTSVEQTIEACDDIFQFQLIAKAGMKYREAYHSVDGEQQPVQKVNRVYATKDERFGKLFKVKAEDASTAKIEMLPEHCIIDNNNQLSINDVDKTFYIEMAKKRINDFKGIKPEKKKGGRRKMATAASTKKTTEKTETLSIFKKLLKARTMFLESDIKKSGKNMHLTYKYFELGDIVPVATRIFSEIGLLSLVTYDNETASMTLVNTDNPEETIQFTSPMREIEPIISNTKGTEVTNAIQRLGSVETYQRRYLYMAALDIVESDEMEANTGKGESAPATQNKPPATPEQREGVKKGLTQPEGNASTLQIKQLKAALKKLKEKRPDKEEFNAKIAVDTEGFKVISKADCEKILTGIAGMLEEEEVS